VNWRRAHPPHDRAQRARRRILYCGEATRRKGFDLLPEIVRRVSEARPEADFLIQIHTWQAHDPLTQEMTELARTRPNVQTVAGFTLPDDFYALLDDADVVLLPYQADVYKQGTSAIFEEATYLGRPAVVTPETMMATAIGQHPDSGAVAAGLGAPAIADAVIRVLADFPRFQAGAARAAEIWRARDGINRFAEFLVDHARRA
jgi:glycosyltransferase involved in cell wall biosynthesis